MNDKDDKNPQNFGEALTLCIAPLVFDQFKTSGDEFTPEDIGTFTVAIVSSIIDGFQKKRDADVLEFARKSMNVVRIAFESGNNRETFEHLGKVANLLLMTKAGAETAIAVSAKLQGKTPTTIAKADLDQARKLVLDYLSKDS